MADERQEVSEPARVLASLANLLYDSDSFDGIATALCRACPVLITGCSSASLMVGSDGRYLTLAASDAVAAEIDELERQLGEGPCVDAIDDEIPQLEEDLANGSKWPKLGQAIVQRTPVRSAMAFRIRTGMYKGGALNIFGNEPGAFSADSVDQAVVLAAFASVLMGARSHRQQAETLRRGLERSREIGKAVGLLMGLHGLSDDAAFDRLVQVSQHTNSKLADVAAGLLAQYGNEVPPPPS